MQREITLKDFEKTVNSVDDIEPLILKRENKKDLLVISLEQYQKESKLLAESITSEVLKVSGVARRTRPVQNALFYVLKGAVMPSTLIELGFITNPADAKFMNTKGTRLKMVKATAEGIKKYIELFEKTKGFTK